MHPRGQLGPAPAFPNVQADTLGIWSSGDAFLLERAMVESGAHVDGTWRYERVEGASHWMQLDAPNHINALLLDWLT